MTENREKRALIVEDSEDIAELIEFVLQQEGYQCDKVDDGKTAFRMATTQKYTLLVVDVYLPNWNGVEMLNSLSMVQEPVPIILCTGANAASISQDIENEHVIEVLQKPFEVPVFKDAVRRAESV